MNTERLGRTISTACSRAADFGSREHPRTERKFNPLGSAGDGCTKRDAAGFTLLELLVVLAIMALVVAVGTPMVSNALPGAHLRTATNDLTAALRATRNQAITRNRSAALLIDTRSRQYRLDHEPAARQLPTEISLTLVTAQSEQTDGFTGRIRFFPDGSSTGGRITLSGPDREHSISVNWILGRVRVDGR